MSEAVDEYIIDEEDGISEIVKACLQSYTEDMYVINSYELKYLIPYLGKRHETSLLHVLQNVEYVVVLMDCVEKTYFPFNMKKQLFLQK